MSAADILRTFGAHDDGTSLKHFGQPEAEYKALTAGQVSTFTFMRPSPSKEKMSNAGATACSATTFANCSLYRAIAMPSAMPRALSRASSCLLIRKQIPLFARWNRRRLVWTALSSIFILDDIELEPLDEHCTLSLIGPKATTIASKLGYSTPKRVSSSSPPIRVGRPLDNGLDKTALRLSVPSAASKPPLKQHRVLEPQLTGQIGAHPPEDPKRISGPGLTTNTPKKPLLHALRLNHDCCAFDKDAMWAKSHQPNRCQRHPRSTASAIKLSGAVPTGTSLVDPEKNKTLAPLTSISIGRDHWISRASKGLLGSRHGYLTRRNGQTATVLAHPNANPESATPVD